MSPLPSGDSGEETPVPIPNTEVKLSSADGSWGQRPCKSRSLLGIEYGVLAQRESTTLTAWGSLVRSQYTPPSWGVSSGGERFAGSEEVRGSNPLRSIDYAVVAEWQTR
jgi:hypothetical protein